MTFNEGVTIHFEGTLEETVDGLDIGFTNCNFTFGDDNTVYHLSPDGTQIHDAEENVIDTLPAQYNVKSFTIKMSGDVDGTTMFSVALDDKADSYQFVTYNFVNTNDGAIVSNTNVTWSIESSSSDGASITADGLLTFSKAGEIVVKATSKENDTVTATYTVRVNSVISAVVGLQQGEITETVAFDSEYTADFTIMSDGRTALL